MQIKTQITAVVAQEQKAYASLDDGRVVSFDSSALQNHHDFARLKIGSMIKAELEDDKLSRITIIDIDDDEFDVYSQPDEFLFLQEPPFVDWLLIDYGKYVLAKGDKSLIKAKARLKDLALEVGANSIIDYKVKKEVRNVMGYGFEYYYACGVAAIVAKKDLEGDCSLEYLQHRLKQDKIKKLGNMLVNVKIGKIIVNVLAIALFIVFAIGFVVSSL